MRKLIWCCSAAGLVATGSFLSLVHYAYHCPNSVVGRSMQVVAQASVAIQPLSGLTSLAVRVNRANAPSHESAGAIEECIPDDPQPIAPEPVQEPEGIIGQVSPVSDREMKEMEAAPIVIGEEDPMPREEIEDAAPVSSDVAAMQRQEIPAKGSPVFMPYCPDDDEEPAIPPKMPRADVSDDKKTGDSRTKKEHDDFKEWMELFEENKEGTSTTVELLPAPKEEEPNAEPKCQEDVHRDEHYSGCPRTTCPFSPMKKKGSEESSEEPPHPAKKTQQNKEAKDKEESPRTQGVDTMEYRKSDAGLDEYGPGPIH